jgi:hypothetical protein
MDLTVTRPTVIEADAIRVRFEVDKEDLEIIPADFPGLTIAAPGRGMITLVLDLNTRKVRGWPADRSESREDALFVKIRSGGMYDLLCGDEVIASRARCSVPRCIPEEYGDYVTIAVREGGAVYKNEDGTIGRAWAPRAPDVAVFFFPRDED